MNPHMLQTSAVGLLIALLVGCGAPASSDAGRDESFLALMGSDGKADSVYVAEGSAEARALLTVANEASFRDLHEIAGLDKLATANIISHRNGNPDLEHDDNPYESLEELDRTPWVGWDAFVRLRRFAHDEGYVERAHRPLHCATSADCGDGVCHVDRCYDRTTLEIEVPGVEAFEAAGERWWIRGLSSERTVREATGAHEVEQVETTTHDGAVSLLVATSRDGRMTAVTQSGREVFAGDLPPLTLLPNTKVLSAMWIESGLLVAAEARDVNEAAQGLVLYHGTREGWREELKHPFTGARSATEHPTAKFVRRPDGAQLWVDIDGAAMRFDRESNTQWRRSMRIDMAGEGFGSVASEREVEVLQASEDAVFIRRATWNFALKQQVLRVEGTMVTAVIDLPSAVRRVIPHPDQTLTLIYSDGTLGKIENSQEIRGEGVVGVQPGADTLVRGSGHDLYIYDDGLLTTLRAR